MYEIGSVSAPHDTSMSIFWGFPEGLSKRFLKRVLPVVLGKVIYDHAFLRMYEKMEI